MTLTRNFRQIAILSTSALGTLGWAAPALAEDAGDSPAIIVYGRPDGYDTEKTPTATKTSTPLVDVPQAMNVISREQLDDQGIDSLADALRFVPGVVLGQGEGHRDQITLRGQSSTADFFVDGLRDDAQYYRPLYNAERVEVLKGANALIFGRGGGGGVVNRVSKAPEFDRTRIGASGSVDTFGGWTLAADLGAPLSDTIGTRLNAAYEELNNHRQYYNGHFIGVTPTIGAQLGEATTLTATYEYAEDDRLTDRGVPSRAGAPLAGYGETFFGSPALNRSKVTAHLAHMRLDHAVSDNVSANFNAQYGHYDKYYGNVYPRAAVTAAGTVELEGYSNATLRENWIAQGNLVWTGNTGGIGHTLLLGFEGAAQDTVDSRRQAEFGTGRTARTTVTLAERIVLPTAGFGAVSRSSVSEVRALSAYIQDQIDIGEHLKLVAGLRYDHFRITSTNRINGFAGERSDGKWSPRLGVIVKPQENLSLYASYAKSFLPQSGEQFTVLDATTQALAPEAFRNLEAGVKWDISTALAFTLAAYQLDRTNTRATDPVTGNTVLTGKTRTKGIEASLVGQLTDGLQVSLGYALQDGEIRATTTAAPAGRRLAQLPRHQLSAWGRYALTDKLGVGLGLLHQSGQFSTISSAVRMPAFTRLDLGLFYDVSDRIALQLNVENLTDAAYFPSAHTDNNISVGEPLNAKLTLRVKY
ncbi:TonB-dependent siderophore receptor [Novosphingobium sp.]|uniref:TonB-dependent receptor n=1 Tax=Novosphingobium sp. TaxID=1874826 RepID=UPI0027352D62|nr:TonB-dependent siderophore receptor [Novosphingobium sp.]MDP3907803.1 TonB-dependent siderophore receptor [Novosphingobium sp.]